MTRKPLVSSQLRGALSAALTEAAMEPDKSHTLAIKNVPVKVRATMLQHAARRGLTMSEWLTTAVERQAAIEAGDQVLAPRVVPLRSPDETTKLPDVDYTQLTQLLLAAATVAELAEAGTTAATKRMAKHATLLITEKLRELRGLTSRRVAHTRQH